MKRAKREQQRKRQFIDRHVQGAIIIQVVRHWCLFFVGVSLILMVLQKLFGDPNLTIFEHARAVLKQHTSLCLISLCMLPTFINDLIKMSHRFVGPVMRVRSELRRLADGQPVRPIQLRKNDLWQGLAADFNAALATINQEPPADCADELGEEPPATHEEPQLVECEV